MRVSQAASQENKQCFPENFVGLYDFLNFSSGAEIFAEISPCLEHQALVVPQHLPVAVDARPCALTTT